MATFFLLVLSATTMTVSSYFETFLFSLSVKDITILKTSKDTNETKYRFLLKSPQRILGTLVVSKYTSMLLMVCCLTLLLLNVGFSASVPKWIPILCTFASCLISILIFEELLPNLLFQKSKAAFPSHTYPLIKVMDKLLYPLTYGLMKFTTIIDRRMETKTQHNISIEELSETLKLTAVEKKDEKDILQGIVNFGKINVDEIMKPRVDIVDIDIKSSFETVINTIRESEYSRLPVYEDSIDNVKGILYIKDILQHIGKDKNFGWQSLVRKAYFVPETKKIDDLMKEFQDKRIHMAIVVDEFGGTAGIVTLEDILEVIVGDICDEHDEDEHKLYSSIDEHNFILEGKLALNDFFKIKNIDKEKFNDIDSDADTLAGLLLEINGDIPSPGDTIEHEGYVFKIVSADNRRIKKIKLQIPKK